MTDHTPDTLAVQVAQTSTQVQAELSLLLAELRSRAILNFLEIGTDRGGTFHAIGSVCDEDGLKISVDLPRYGYWDNFDYRMLHSQMPNWFPGVHLVHKDSHDVETLAEVKNLLGGRQLDLLFIDGDHSFLGVREDFRMYAPLVRPSGLVALHDIVDSDRHRRQGCHVSRFWRELGGQKREIVVDGTWGGIGLWTA